MDKKTVVICSLLLIVAVCFGWYAKRIFAQEGPIVMENSFGTVTFNHSTHSDIACDTCHHIGTTDQKCTQCHTNDAAVNAQKAFHDSCITCHKEEGKGPAACMDCHKK